MPLGMEVGLGLGDFVLDRDPAPPKKEALPSQFLAYVYCGQTAKRILMPLGSEVGLGPGDIVLDENPVPTLKGATAPQFSALVCCGQMAGCMKMPLGTEIRSRPRRLRVRWGPSSPPKGGGRCLPPVFGPCLLWPNG